MASIQLMRYPDRPGMSLLRVHGLRDVYSFLLTQEDVDALQTDISRILPTTADDVTPILGPQDEEAA